MRLAEIMNKDVQTVPPTMPATDAWNLMRTKGIRHLVVMEGREIRGVLSQRDVGGRSGADLRGRSRVADLMTTSVVTAAPEDTVRRAANLMRGRTIGCVPVMARGRLAGIVTASDLLALLGRGIDRPARPDRRGLHHRVPHRKAAGAFGVW